MADKLQTLSPIKINTKYDRPTLDVGMAGIMLINPTDHEGLQNYHGLAEMVNEYPLGTTVYAQASKYFSNENSPLFQVLSYKAGDGNSLTTTMKKYYFSGAEYFLVHMSVDDKNLSDISAISNFVEAQDNKVLIVDLAYTDENKYQDAYKSLNISNNMATLVSAKNLINGNDEFLGASFLSIYANAKLGTDAALVHDLPGVTPQDKYEFSAEELEKYFVPNKVATYAWRGGYSMMTSGVTQSGDQLQAIVVRDALTNEITANLMNVLIQNEGRVTYDSTGIKMLENSIYGTLQKYVDNGYIQPGFSVNTVDPNQISENKKASGKLTGMGWKYTPNFTINDATFSQTVVLPEVL